LIILGALSGSSGQPEKYAKINGNCKGESALVNGLAGRYEDHLVKQGDRWLFKTRKVHFDLMGDMS
jgi:hypothetical protein